MKKRIKEYGRVYLEWYLKGGAAVGPAPAYEPYGLKWGEAVEIGERAIVEAGVAKVVA